MASETEVKHRGSGGPSTTLLLLGTVITIVVGVIAIHDFFARDEPELIAHCQSLPARASLDALAGDKTKPPLGFSGPYAGWSTSGYVACQIANNGRKLARDVGLNVARPGEITFYEGSLVSSSKSGELKLGDMRPGTHKDVEYFSNGLTLVPVTSSSEGVYLSYADGSGKVLFAVSSYGWVGSVSEFLSAFSNAPIPFLIFMLFIIMVFLGLRPVGDRITSWLEARFPRLKR